MGRIGTFGAHERVSRHENYMTFEAWSSNSYTQAHDYYVWGEVFRKPFVVEDNKVAYAATRDVILDPQPTGDLKSKVLDIEDTVIHSNFIGSVGLTALFVNRPGSLPLSSPYSRDMRSKVVLAASRSLHIAHGRYLHDR